MKKRKVIGAALRVLITICAAFSAVCFVSYLLSVLSHAGTFFSYALPIAACAVVILPPVLENTLSARLQQKCLPRKLFRAGQILYGTAVVFFTVTFCFMLGALHSYENSSPENVGDTVICVYGCRVKGENPSEMLRERLDAALTLLDENPSAVCIVSGALDEGETYTEGQVMAWYLAEHGIDEERILIDETAESTKGNIRAYLALIGEHDLDGYNIISVSSSFHMPRIEFLCGKYGLDCTFVGAPTERFSLWFPSVVREYMAYVKMILLNSYV